MVMCYGSTQYRKSMIWYSCIAVPYRQYTVPYTYDTGALRSHTAPYSSTGAGMILAQSRLRAASGLTYQRRETLEYSSTSN